MIIENSPFLKKYYDLKVFEELKKSAIIWMDKQNLLNKLNQDLYINQNSLDSIELNFQRYIKKNCNLKLVDDICIEDFKNIDIIKFSYNGFLYNFLSIKNKMKQYIINKEKREGVFYSKKRGRYERKKD
jgi:hypothetical protein